MMMMVSVERGGREKNEAQQINATFIEPTELNERKSKEY